MQRVLCRVSTATPDHDYQCCYCFSLRACFSHPCDVNLPVKGDPGAVAGARRVDPFGLRRLPADHLPRLLRVGDSRPSDRAPRPSFGLPSPPQTVPVPSPRSICSRTQPGRPFGRNFDGFSSEYTRVEFSVCLRPQPLPSTQQENRQCEPQHGISSV